MKAYQRDFNNQLDLTPFISLLSVCICFLLLTVAWFQIGALTMKQTIGGASSENKKDKDTSASVWIRLAENGSIEVKLKNLLLNQKLLARQNDQMDLETFSSYIRKIKKQTPDLKQVFIFPTKDTSYQNIVKVMDSVRKVGIFDVGISPL